MNPDTRLEATVLVADDEPSIARGIQRVLQSCGATVDLTHDGAEAAAQLTAQDYDLAFIDLIMPQFGGMELLDRISAAGLPVVPIVITAHASIETAVEAVRRGAFDYLPKPFVPQELVLRAQRALAWRRLREEAERRLLELDSDKTQLHTIVNSLVDGVLVVNVEGRLVLSNPAARAALGLSLANGEAPPVAEALREPCLAALLGQAAAQPPGQRASLSARFERGQQVFMARVVPLETPGGDYLGTATVLRDVTELISLERAKSRFMSMVAHELKTPLAAVQGFLNVMLADPALPVGKRQELVERCTRRNEGMIQMVRDLLDLSQANALPVRRLEPLEVAPLVAEVLELNQSLAERGEICLGAEVDPACPSLTADREDLARLLGNLVSNAIKYNRPGGSVTIRARSEGVGVALEVADTGLGLPPEALARIGEEFFRLNLPDRRGIVGTGLGLALVKRAVDSYQGRLRVISELGQGSTFTVWLPLGPVGPATTL